MFMAGEKLLVFTLVKDIHLTAIQRGLKAH